MSKMIDDYFKIYTEKVKEYGENTVVLHQTGSFYEIYEVNNTKETIGNAKRMSKILDMTYANKKGNTNNSTRTNPNFIGFNCSILNKYLGILLRNGFTVVIVDQLESSKKGKLVERGVTKIYSPSLLPSDITEAEGDFNLVSMLFNINPVKKSSNKKNATLIQTMNVSICCINNNNNTIEITDNEFKFLPNDQYTLNLSLSSIDRILYRFNPKELQIGFNEIDIDTNIQNLIVDYFNENYENVRFNELNDLYKTIDYQNKYLKETYDHINFGLIIPIEYLQFNSELSVINMIYILKFVEAHDKSYIKNLTVPKHIIENNFLISELNTLAQLNVLKIDNNIVNSKINCLFDVINYTKTALGKRYLKNILSKPFKDPKVINNRYAITEGLDEVKDKSNSIDIILNEILDIEKLHRKMGISELHQFEFVKLNECYLEILKLYQLLHKNTKLKELVLDNFFNESDMLEFNDYIKNYNETFDLEKMKKFNLKTGKDELENYILVIKELDIIQEKIDTLEDKRKELRLKLDKLINDKNSGDFIKLVYTEFEGYSFSCTKIRYQALLQKINKGTSEICIDSHKTWKVKQTNSIVKFIPQELDKLSNEILSNRELLSIKITLNYKRILLEYYRKYNPIFDKLKNLVEIIDVCNSNLKCAQKFNYTKPELIVKDESFIEIESIRHPIIERLGQEYISNDIILNDKTNGILCFGINSSGKSSLLRAIGVATIMAQAGLFVAAKSFKFSPFDTIISQVDLSDNIFAGKSSFITEMLGLKRILQCAGPRTLVLSDELCRGTEHSSSVGLVSATILQLIKTNTKFFFTSHLHEVPKVQDIIDLKDKLNICHLSVNIKSNNIIYERKLQNGPGSSLYGLEVSKSLLECSELVEKAFKIRNNLIGNETKVKKSKYNTKKIIDKCQICSSTKQLEVDHIVPQMTANENGFLNDSRHKNHISNLCTLCHDCHLNKTLGKIKIHGYKDSINGRFLDWERL